MNKRDELGPSKGRGQSAVLSVCRLIYLSSTGRHICDAGRGVVVHSEKASKMTRLYSWKWILWRMSTFKLRTIRIREFSVLAIDDHNTDAGWYMVPLVLLFGMLVLVSGGETTLSK